MRGFRPLPGIGAVRKDHKVICRNTGDQIPRVVFFQDLDGLFEECISRCRIKPDIHPVEVREVEVEKEVLFRRRARPVLHKTHLNVMKEPVLPGKGREIIDIVNPGLMGFRGDGKGKEDPSGLIEDGIDAGRPVHFMIGPKAKVQARCHLLCTRHLPSHHLAVQRIHDAEKIPTRKVRELFKALTAQK